MQINLDVQDDETVKSRKPKQVVTMVMLKGVFNLEIVSIWYAKENIFNSALEEKLKIMQNPVQATSKDKLEKIEKEEDSLEVYEEAHDDESYEYQEEYGDEDSEEEFLDNLDEDADEQSEYTEEELEELAAILVSGGEDQLAELESMTKAEIKEWADAFEFNVPLSLSKAEMIERFI